MTQIAFLPERPLDLPLLHIAQNTVSLSGRYGIHLKRFDCNIQIRDNIVDGGDDVADEENVP